MPALYGRQDACRYVVVHGKPPPPTLGRALGPGTESAGKTDALQTLRECLERRNGAAAFGVRGACSRFLGQVHGKSEREFQLNGSG